MSVSRSGSLKIPKRILDNDVNVNSKLDKQNIFEAYKMAKEKYKDVSDINDKDLEKIDKIPHNSNDLIVVTIVKKLTAYVILITEKSPKKFRGVFVNRMQNKCLDTLELLLEANYTNMNSLENKKIRESLQKKAIINLRTLGYISMLAQSSNCILPKQYKQISMQLHQAINLIMAWKKSDDKRFKQRIID